MPHIVAGVDLFCGAGGLTYGLQKAGIDIVAGIDLDPTCEFPFTSNNASRFLKIDIRTLTVPELAKLYPSNTLRLLAGCAPCKPFSPFRRGADNSKHDDWGLLRDFARLVEGLGPELVTMENVPGLASRRMFASFVRTLRALGYHIDYKSVYCPPLGIPQHRRRLVLIASLIGKVEVPLGFLQRSRYRTVRDAISDLPPLSSGETDPKDPLHKARSLSPTNLLRLRSSAPGRTWQDWPEHLRAPCHRRKKGSTYQSVYSRMTWDDPSPTITTQSYNFGTGRFGHPEQDRPITLREAAVLQTFPRGYRFVGPGDRIFFQNVGRLIGNAVPPRLAFFVGKALLRSLEA
jgi:DNA (cytosine-5)-methyltransferase 1